MPGLPPPGTSDAHEFAQLFWSALYAALVASLVTGLVVGVVLWRLQMHAEVRARRQTAVREVEVFRERLRLALDQPEALNPKSARETTPAAARAAIALSADVPLRAWRRDVPAAAPLLNSVERVQRAHAAFGAVADRLEFRLHQVIRRRHAAGGVAAADDPAARFFALGRLHGVPGDELLPWMDQPTTALPQLEQDYAAIAADAQFGALVPSYREAWQGVIDATEALRRCVQDGDVGATR